jgi:hypothetical protein
MNESKDHISMLTEKQLEANRANAQKSTGPKTDAGKKRSSLNAFRHGLTGQVVVLPEEDRQAFEQLTEKTIAELQVRGEHELQLARTYCMSLWNVQRAMAVQDTMFSLGVMEEVAENLNIEDPQAHNAVSYAKTFRTDSEAFNRISLYTQRLINQSKALRKELEEVQASRFAIQRAEINQVVLAHRFKQMMGEAFDPAEFGFVFSLDEVCLFERRHHLINQAEIAYDCHFIRGKYEEKAKRAAA